MLTCAMCGAMRPLLLLVLLSLWAVAGRIPSAAGHNITSILEKHPDYSKFNDALTQTKVADDINSRTTITVLVLSNSNMGKLDSAASDDLRKQLSLYVLLDYFDTKKLLSLADGSINTTTLFQSTGDADSRNGFLNITDGKGGTVSFRSSATAADPAAAVVLVKSVEQQPYNISVLEISGVIRAPGVSSAAPGPAPAAVNLTAALDKAGCRTFAALLESSGVLGAYGAAATKGLTVFAPNDEALKSPGLPDLRKLTKENLATLLKSHAISDYNPLATLKVTKRPIGTMASGSVGNFDLTFTTAGDEVTLHPAGGNSSKIVATVLDADPVAVFAIDGVLLPAAVFGKGNSSSPSPSKSPAPAPTPKAGQAKPPAPAPGKPAAAPSPAETPQKAPAPKAASPPEAGGSSPDNSPAEAPGADSENSKSGAARLRAPAAVVAGAVIVWSLMS